LVTLLAFSGLFGSAVAKSASPRQPAPALAVTTTPPLQPAFSSSKTDYVVRCREGESVRVRATARAPLRIAIDGARGQTGVSSRSVPLAAGQAFSVKASDPRSRVLQTYSVRCLPEDFPAYSAERPGLPQSAWYLITHVVGAQPSRYVSVFSNTGVPVWWFKSEFVPIDASLLANGHLAWARYLPYLSAPPEPAYEERGLDGSLVRMVKTVGTETDHHELQLLPGGNYLLVSYKPRAGVDLSEHGGPASAEVFDAEIQEVTPAGALVWRWNSSDHIELQETGRWHSFPPATTLGNRTLYDIVHINSVAADRDSVIFSARHLDAVYKVSRSTGEIVWKLGGTRRPESLELIGDRVNTIGAQHDARVLPDGTLSLFDNATGLGRPPRVLRLRIDEPARTARVVEDLTDPDVGSSFCCGSARKLRGGNWVVGWGGSGDVTEMTPAGRRVFRLRIPAAGTYRAFPIERAVLAPTALRTAMDLMHPRQRSVEYGR
jgi:hypothetical protein